MDSLPAIRFSGLVTGLDSASLVSSLVAAERVPLTRMESQQSTLLSQKQLMGDLASRVRSLETLATAAKKAAVVKSASSSDAAQVGITASTSASAGVHQLKIFSRAAATSLISQGHASATDTGVLGTGTLVINVGSTATNVTVASGEDSLEKLRDAINASGADVTASVVDDGSATGQRLVVSGKSTGLANAVTLDASGLTGGSDPLTVSTLKPAADASFELDGLAMTRSSNTVSDALAGVTLTLKGQTGSTIDLTVATDGTGSAQPLLTLVNSFNSLVQVLRDRTRPASEGVAAGPLSGDFAARGALERLKGAIAASKGPEDQLPNLSALGITSNRDGTLTVDAAKVAQAWLDDPAAVAELTKDAATRLEAVSDQLGLSGTGTFDARASALDKNIRDLDDRIARKETSLAKLETQLTLRFTALETLASQLKTQGDALTALLTKSES